MGGSVAAYWAGTRPERLAALALARGPRPARSIATVDLPGRTAQWIDAWRKARATKPEGDAVARRRGRAAAQARPAARRSRSRCELAEAGTRAVDGGLAWKHDPLHLTMGPYPFRRDTAAQYWQRDHVPRC